MGILDCVTSVVPSGVQVKNANRFYDGQTLRVLRDLKGKDIGTLQIVKVDEKRKELTISSGIIPKVGDYLMAAK